MMDLDTFGQYFRVKKTVLLFFVYSSPSCTEISLSRKKSIYQHLSALATFVPGGHERAVLIS